MAFFTYRGLDKENKIVTGDISGKTADEAAELLNKRDIKPLTIKRTRQKERGGKLPIIEKITFCRYASAMLKSGLPLSKGIEVLQEETKQPVMKKILGDISYGLEEGQQLSTIFEKYPKVFDHFFLTLVRVGEASGTLADVFAYLEKGLRAEYSLSQKVKGAMLYPMVVFSAMIGIGGLMFFFVLPQIAKVFLNMEITLPTPTRILFQSSIYLSLHMVPFLATLFIAAVFFVLFIRTDTGKRFGIGLLARVPVIRDLMQKVDLARFTRILSTLISSAVPITESIEIAIASFSWSRYQKAGEKIKTLITQGKPLSESFKEQKVFPALLIQMIAAGEKTGTLDKTLRDLALFYEEKVGEGVKNATQVLEPILILIVGIGVGAMVLSIIAPIYSVVSTLQSEIAR